MFFLQGWIWRWTNYESWYAIKQRNQTFSFWFETDLSAGVVKYANCTSAEE